MKINPKDFIPAKPHARVSSGEVIRILRDKKGWTQEQPPGAAGSAPPTLVLLKTIKSTLESDGRRP